MCREIRSFVVTTVRAGLRNSPGRAGHRVRQSVTIKIRAPDGFTSPFMPTQTVDEVGAASPVPWGVGLSTTRRGSGLPRTARLAYASPRVVLVDHHGTTCARKGPLRPTVVAAVPQPPRSGCRPIATISGVPGHNATSSAAKRRVLPATLPRARSQFAVAWSVTVGPGPRAGCRRWSATSPARYPANRTPTGHPGQAGASRPTGGGRPPSFDHSRPPSAGRIPERCHGRWGWAPLWHRGVDRGSGGGTERANHLGVDLVVVCRSTTCSGVAPSESLLRSVRGSSPCQARWAQRHRAGRGRTDPRCQEFVVNRSPRGPTALDAAAAGAGACRRSGLRLPADSERHPRYPKW